MAGRLMKSAGKYIEVGFVIWLVIFPPQCLSFELI